MHSIAGYSDWSEMHQLTLLVLSHSTFQGWGTTTLQFIRNSTSRSHSLQRMVTSHGSYPAVIIMLRRAAVSAFVVVSAFAVVIIGPSLTSGDDSLC